MNTRFQRANRVILASFCFLLASYHFSVAIEHSHISCDALEYDGYSSRPAPKKNGNWEYWSRRREQIIASLGTVRPAVVFLGDSLTERWPPDVFKELSQSLTAVNYAIEGENTNGLSWRIMHDNILNDDAKLIVLLIGTNNRENPPDIAGAIAGLVNQIHTLVPGATIMLIGILPRDRPADDYIRIQTINNYLKECVDQDFLVFRNYDYRFIDKYGEIDRRLYLQDGIHLNRSGYVAFGKLLSVDIKKIVMGAK